MFYCCREILKFDLFSALGLLDKEWNICCVGLELG
jgi:hypothetical protein